MSGVLAINVARYGLAVVFLLAGSKHYAHVPLFVAMIHDYRILPFPAAVALGEFVPRLELLLGMFLLFGRWLAEVYLVVTGLVVMFLLAAVLALVRGLDISCGCWGADSPPISWWHAMFLMVILACTLMALRLQLKHKTREAGNGQALAETS